MIKFLLKELIKSIPKILIKQLKDNGEIYVLKRMIILVNLLKVKKLIINWCKTFQHNCMNWKISNQDNDYENDL